MNVALECFVLAALGSLAAICRRLTGFGGALIVISGWLLAHSAFGVGKGSLTEAVAYSMLVDLLMIPTMVVSMWASVDLTFSLGISVVWGGVEFFATRVLVGFGETNIMRICFGVLLGSIYLGELARPARTLVPFNLHSRRGLLFCAVLAIGGGFLRGCFGIPLPVLVGFALFSGMEQQQWVASIAMVTLATSPFKLANFFYVLDQWDAACGWQYVTIAVSPVPFVFVGEKLAAHLRPSLFRELVLLLALAGSSSLVGHGQQVLVAGALAACGVPLRWRKKPAFEPVALQECPGADGDQDVEIEAVDATSIGAAQAS